MHVVADVAGLVDAAAGESMQLRGSEQASLRVS